MSKRRSMIMRFISYEAELEQQRLECESQQKLKAEQQITTAPQKRKEINPEVMKQKMKLFVQKAQINKIGG